MDPAHHVTAQPGPDSTGDGWPPGWWPPAMPWTGEATTRLEHARVVAARRWPPRQPRTPRPAPWRWAA